MGHAAHSPSRQPIVWIATATFAVMTAAVAQPQWQILPPIVKQSKPPVDDASKRTTPAPMRKEEAREKEEFARLTIERIFVEGSADEATRKRREMEQRFANALNRGNPEVPGGKIRHGAYYDGYVYWGSDPFSFLWLNTITRLRE
jgi:hypothetical protein